MLDYIGIFRELNKNGVKYVVVGGIAVNLHGIPRATYDIDLLVEMSNENLKKIVKLLKKWGFKPKVPLKVTEILVEKNREKWIKEKNMKAFCLYNPVWAISEIDILIDSSVEYEQAVKNLVYKQADDVVIPVISIGDLIKMKKGSKRKQDLADIRYLKKKL